ncbi:MAG: response regulator [bacterium]
MIKRTILAVDDNKVVLAAVHQTLSSKYNLLMANDGHEAIELANEHKVDLVLLDIMMPGFDGFSTLTLLKESAETKHIPVIMLTAVGKKEKVIEAFREGAAGYILKPFKADALLSKIESVLVAHDKEMLEMQERVESEAAVETDGTEESAGQEAQKEF